jgi:hypothetical protein
MTSCSKTKEWRRLRLYTAYMDKTRFVSILNSYVSLLRVEWLCETCRSAIKRVMLHVSCEWFQMLFTTHTTNINQFIKTEWKNVKISGITSFVSIKWRYACTPPVIFGFNKMAAHFHAIGDSSFQQNGCITNSTFQQNGGTIAHNQ